MTEQKPLKTFSVGCSLGWDFVFEQDHEPTEEDIFAKVHTALEKKLANGGFSSGEINIEYVEEVLVFDPETDLDLEEAEVQQK